MSDQPPFTGGPLSQADLLGIWESVMDDSYTEPFIEAGDGGGLEAWNQAFAQLERVSLAVDVSMQSLFILPWSGQTNPPASGPNQATVELTISRTGLPQQPLILLAGQYVDEVAPDWSATGTQMVVTGLRYYLQTNVVFEPGESGPLTVTAVAERPGYGYNNPLPDSLSLLEQPGTQYYNVDAAVTNTLPSLPVSPGSLAQAQMIVLDVPHVVVPGHVGQYVAFTAGSNIGAVAQMVAFRPANPGVDGGAVNLALLFSIHASTFSGTFSVGELSQIESTTLVTAIAVGSNGQTLPQATVFVASTAGFPSSGQFVVDGSVVSYTGTTSGSFTGCTGGTATLATTNPVAAITGYASFVHQVQVGAITKASFVMRSGAVAPTDVILGTQSGASVSVDIVYRDASTLVQTGTEPPSTESWRVLDWVEDWGLSVSNAEQPSGGTAAVLDLLGKERNLPRITGEEDDTYRQRVAAIADVVTPNAVKRRLNKTLTQGPLGLSWCFREIGTPLFPGLFLDVDFFDYDAQGVSLSASAGFQPYEPVTQSQGGVLATGKVLFSRAPPSATPGVGVLVPGNAGATGIPGIRQFGAIAGQRIGYPFVAGVPVRGTISGSTWTPALVLGGLGVQYPGNNPANPPVSNAWRILVDYLRMRGYFAVTVQRSGDGDFGFGWGSGSPGVGALADWWDSGPGWNDFYDGAPLGAAGQNLNAFHAINAIRAAGVFFEILPSSGPCV
jgi:hypothetical protein